MLKDVAVINLHPKAFSCGDEGEIKSTEKHESNFYVFATKSQNEINS